MLRKSFGLNPQGVSAFFMAASIPLGLSAGEHWLPRALAALLLLLGGVSILILMILSRKFSCIGPRLANKSLKLRLTVETLGRLLFVALVIFAAPTLFYMCVDLYGLIKRGYPIRTEAVVTYVPRGAIWSWIWKDIGLETRDGGTSQYNLFFHPSYPKQGEQYQAVILPKSRCLLSLQPVLEDRKGNKVSLGLH